MELKRIDYRDLNSRQKENYNFQKISAILADYGFCTLRLSDDWEGADFLAVHIDGKTLLRVQLKSRLAFSDKYEGKDLYIAFRDGDDWYLYPHDDVLEKVLSDTGVESTRSWQDRGGYSFPSLSKAVRDLLCQYRIGGTTAETISADNPAADGGGK